MSDQNSFELHQHVTDDLKQLVHNLRTGDVPEQALLQAQQLIQQASDILAPHVQQGKGWSTATVTDQKAPLVWHKSDLTRVMPYSPISGLHNATSPVIKIWKSGSEAVGEAYFSPVFAGPPNSVHGGVIAAVFDELLSMANVVSGGIGFTGWLTIRYHQKTPLETPIELYACNEKRDGRKLLTRGEMRVNGEVTASAEGLFIAPKQGDKPVLSSE